MTLFSSNVNDDMRLEQQMQHTISFLKSNARIWDQWNKWAEQRLVSRTLNCIELRWCTLAPTLHPIHPRSFLHKTEKVGCTCRPGSRLTATAVRGKAKNTWHPTSFSSAAPPPPLSTSPPSLPPSPPPLLRRPPPAGRLLKMILTWQQSDLEADREPTTEEARLRNEDEEKHRDSSVRRNDCVVLLGLHLKVHIVLLLDDSKQSSLITGSKREKIMLKDFELIGKCTMEHDALCKVQLSCPQEVIKILSQLAWWDIWELRAA